MESPLLTVIAALLHWLGPGEWRGKKKQKNSVFYQILDKKQG
jgi:hypothetical protein